MRKKLSDQEIAEVYRHVSILIPEIWGYFVSHGPMVAGAAIAELASRYIAGWKDEETQRRALTALMTSTIALVADLNRGIDPLAASISDEKVLSLPSAWKVEYSPLVAEHMAEDSAAADFVRSTVANIKNALAAFDRGEFPSIGDAMESLGLKRMTEDEMEELHAERPEPKTRH